jgi:hypothetical protein
MLHEAVVAENEVIKLKNTSEKSSLIQDSLEAYKNFDSQLIDIEDKK